MRETICGSGRAGCVAGTHRRPCERRGPIRRGLSVKALEPIAFALQQYTGSFTLSLLCIPVLMAAMAIGVTMMVPEHSGKELNEIIV
jgi:hypothetical protein